MAKPTLEQVNKELERIERELALTKPDLDAAKQDWNAAKASGNKEALAEATKRMDLVFAKRTDLKTDRQVMLATKIELERGE